MMLFPAIDPIPLPAPVWLFKALHLVTLSLHFGALEMLLGGLLIATWLNARGARRNGQPAALRRGIAAALARRLPIVMTFVINLGVPPLLFAQVLYGRALYTSSVLIGVYWIGVIFLLMACYWLLYRFAAGTEQGRAVWWQGALAWVLAGCIARIYSTNMTLMLRPDVWAGMYAASPGGALLPPFDPTLTPRWLFMLTGGFWVAGLWMLWLAGRPAIDSALRRDLAARGGRLAVVMTLVQVAVACWLWSVLPAPVRETLAGSALARGAALAWLVLIAAVLLLGAASALRKPQSAAIGYIALALTVLTMLAMTAVRDQIRDAALLAHGFDVWQRTCAPNWSVVIIFLVVFTAGLAAMAWLIAVVRRARPIPEGIPHE